MTQTGHPQQLAFHLLNDKPELVRAHRLGGYLFASRRQDAFRSEWRTQWLENSLLLGELHALAPGFASRGVRPIVLKGAAWIDELYGDRGARVLSDIDLCVPESARETVAEVFSAAGYRACFTDHWEAAAFAVVYLKVIDGIEIAFDVHHGRIFSDERAFEWRTESFLDGQYERLIAEDALVHFCGHLCFQNGFRGVGGLLDVALLIEKRKATLDWQRVWHLARALRRLRSVELSLACCVKYHGISPLAPSPRGVVARLVETLVSPTYLRYPYRHIARYVVLKHLLRGGWRRALADDFLWARQKLWTRKNGSA